MAKDFNKVKTNLPFFAYGLFKKDELAFHQIQEYIDNAKPIQELKIKGILYSKDGCAVLVRSRDCDTKVKGDLLFFNDKNAKAAYELINKMESDFYQWETYNKGKQHFNYLAMNQLCYCSSEPIEIEGDTYSWSSKNDLMFNNCMVYLYHNAFEKICDYDIKEQFGKTLDDMFVLQMYYLLLFSVLNRYSSFKYEAKGKSSVSPECFKEIEKYKDNNNIQLKSTDQDVTESNSTKRFDADDNDDEFGDFFRVIRNNAVHNGKELLKDMDMLKKAFVDLFYLLYCIFRDNLNVPFVYCEEENPQIQHKIDDDEITRLYNNYN